MNIKILVATHKKYWIPEDDVYFPIHVGREGKVDLGYTGDNTGDNISLKNTNYCELTGLYWAWKNLDCEYIGLCHYRRYFGKKFNKLTDHLFYEKEMILSRSKFENLLNKYEIILPQKRVAEEKSLYEEYRVAHNIRDLEKCREIISEFCPEYLYSFDYVLNKRDGYFCNMFVMEKKKFDVYCEWLFNILFTLESRIDISGYDDYQKRIYGFLSERLMNVFLHKHSLSAIEVPVVYMERRISKRKLRCRKIWHLFYKN